MRSRDPRDNSHRRTSRRGVLGALLAVCLIVAATLPASGMGLRDAVTPGVSDVSTPNGDDRTTGDARTMEIVSLAQGTYSGVTDERVDVVTDAAAFARLWREAHSGMVPAPDPPDIDFSIEIVVSVFMGTRTSGGYAIEVIGAVETAETIRVSVSRRAPGPDDFVTMAITSPYHIVALERRGKPVTVEFD
ncbi:MAG: protease complex subunit PrcB family protein [Spirochaetaceae bacterium]|nr:MAG: protease complex subunit PrcB family protein [Spirochaetaceae bacterium]